MMTIRARIACALAVGVVCAPAFALDALAADNALRTNSVTKAAVSNKPAAPRLIPVIFADVPGWAADDHLAAWKAFKASCKPVLTAAKSGTKSGAKNPPAGLLKACDQALGMSMPQTAAAARLFFETHFTPHRIEQSGKGLLTGYYEPLVKGSRVPAGAFQTPVYKRPTDLVNLVSEGERGAKSGGFTHMRQTTAGLVPFPTRAEIEQGALKGRNLELMYFHDPVDVYFLQVQGSARVELPDGKKVRITYDGKNGHPYTSIGKALIEDGRFSPESMSLEALATWLKADRKRAEPLMWRNQSYVFFRELQGAESGGAMGVLGIELQPGRSLAVDTSFHAIGTPIFVSSPSLTHAAKTGGFARLMVAQDAGSAIKGVERGDIFFGSGDGAGRIAGNTKHQGQFFVLMANDETAASGPEKVHN